ncbi:MAG: CHAP domain-containing protein, partial [Euzebyales bacterium]|nr:CHAP domain-containing protein [Euzebyales bacterium]
RADGRRARLRCRKEGAEVAGTRRWYKLRSGAVVSAALIDAPAAARDLRTCGRPRGDDYYVRYTGESIDPFRFYSRYCTSFAAWRANQIGVNFSNFYKDQHWGNAEHWDEAARAAGITVARTPKRGDIAQWNPNVNGASFAGHVGYVARVFDDGSVRIAEYNWATPREFGTRRVHRSKISNFIRLKG